MIKECRSCEHWRGQRDPDWQTFGGCHRRSPVAVDHPRERGQIITQWPSTYADDLCGEYVAWDAPQEKAADA